MDFGFEEDPLPHTTQNAKRPVPYLYLHSHSTARWRQATRWGRLQRARGAECPIPWAAWLRPDPMPSRYRCTRLLQETASPAGPCSPQGSTHRSPCSPTPKIRSTCRNLKQALAQPPANRVQPPLPWLHADSPALHTGRSARGGRPPLSPACRTHTARARVQGQGGLAAADTAWGGPGRAYRGCNPRHCSPTLIRTRPGGEVLCAV